MHKKEGLCISRRYTSTGVKKKKKESKAQGAPGFEPGTS